MFDSDASCRQTLEMAKAELAELIATEHSLAKRKVHLRMLIEALATLCQSENIEFQGSPEALYLLKHTSLADEIRTILRTQYPACLSPGEVKTELKRLGHDLSKYRNAQATIHTVLKRMTESQSDPVQELVRSNDGRQEYSYPGLQVSIASTRQDGAASRFVGDKELGSPPMKE